jgi:hypothetical protein
MSRRFVSHATPRRALRVAVAFGCLALLAGLALLPPAVAARAADADGGAKDDLARVQGRWERQARAEENAPYRRVTKEVQGSRETVTYYDADGKVLRQHRVDVKLSKTGDVGVFTFSNMEVTEGEGKGQTAPGSMSYLYRVVGDQFREVWGLLPDDDQEPSVIVWTRVKTAATPAPAK